MIDQAGSLQLWRRHLVETGCFLCHFSFHVESNILQDRASDQPKETARNVVWIKFLYLRVLFNGKYTTFLFVRNMSPRIVIRTWCGIFGMKIFTKYIPTLVYKVQSCALLFVHDKYMYSDFFIGGTEALLSVYPNFP